MDGVPNAWLPSRKWLGVFAPRSDGSALTGVNGRAFSACSTRHKVVFNTSSVRRGVPRMVYSNLLKLRNNRSQMPTWRGALGGLNLQLMRLFISSAAMLIVFYFSIHSQRFFSAPIKFAPLSDQIIVGVLRQERNHSTPITQELVSMDGTTSTWTARVVRQVKRNPHLFSVVRRTVS